MSVLTAQEGQPLSSCRNSPSWASRVGSPARFCHHSKCCCFHAGREQKCAGAGALVRTAEQVVCLHPADGDHAAGQGAWRESTGTPQRSLLWSWLLSLSTAHRGSEFCHAKFL